jgi:hypothetical protein
MIRRLVPSLICVFALVSSATVGLVSTSVSAATVTTGSCTAEVDNATGVTMTVATGGDCVLTFTRTGVTTWTVPSGVTSIRALIVGAGGGGSADVGGGGGGGQVVDASNTAVSGNVTITVGAGGAAGYNRVGNATGSGRMGLTSSLTAGGTTVSAKGGSGAIGRFGGNNLNADGTPNNGGYTGGGGAYADTTESATGSTGTGGATYKGGDGSGSGGGGGGGAGGAGASRSSNSNGGVGLSSDITGTSVFYGGGGGGAGYGPAGGIGGTGGGGDGTNNGNDGNSGINGLGGGGGGAGSNGSATGRGGHGGSGVVIVRYSMPATPINSVIPVVSGTTRTGSTLTATSGTWSGAPTFVYQWQRAATSTGTYSNIGSAVNNTYVLTDSDIGKYIKVSVVATNGAGSASALSDATSVVVDLPDSVVPTVTNPVSTTTGFTFSISNYSSSYTYAVTTTKGTVARSTEDVTVTGLSAGESATVTIAVTRTNYKPASKTVTGSAIPAATTTTTTTSTTAAPALSIVIQAPVTTVAQGQLSVATIAPTATTLPVLGANGVLVPTTSTSTTVPVRVVTTTSTVPVIVKNAAPTPPVVEKVAAGQTAVQVDGVKTDAVVTRSNNQMVVTAGSLSATLSGLDKGGKTSPLDGDGNIHLAAGDVIKISVGGFKTGSLVEVWLFSTPTKLGSAVVGADGAINGLFTIPTGIESGSHRVVISAKLPNGKPTTFTLGILVGDISTTSTLTRVLIAIPITLAIGFGFLLPTQIRRRRRVRTS